MSKRNILVTSALPYANGHIHLGHLVEYIQTDIWVRFQKLQGNNCFYMCADDTHGTPIMLSAKKQGITPEALIENMHKEHFADFKAFFIEFDKYYSTNSPENKELAEYIYNAAKENGCIYTREIEQSYCEDCQMFLPDRLIRGTCPRCSAKDQYGDNCEVCGATYSPTELKDAYCSEGHTNIVLKKSEHFFFKLSEFTEKLKNWVAEDHIRSEIKNKLNEWFDQGIKDWDISRDAPYFGFQIPGTTDKYFYVWMDAPVGYIATTKAWCKDLGKDFEQIWKNSDFEIHHFIGKDILYFHTLFWPAMLLVSGFKTPTKVNVHGFLTVNGEKMSKSRGTFINAKTYLECLNPEFLRYYYASKLSPNVEDIDLNLEDFVYKVNAEVVNKVVNIASRLGSILYKKLEGKMSTLDQAGLDLLKQIREKVALITNLYEELEFNKATREVMHLADIANKYIDSTAPWEVIKNDPEKARQICTAGLNAVRLLVILLQPILPNVAAGMERFLNYKTVTWADLQFNLENTEINKYEMLANRILKEDVEKLLQF